MNGKVWLVLEHHQLRDRIIEIHARRDKAEALLATLQREPYATPGQYSIQQWEVL
jgi:hypothetical protein